MSGSYDLYWEKLPCGCEIKEQGVTVEHSTEAQAEYYVVWCPGHDNAPGRIRAAIARINGVWDDPELIKFGPLSTNTQNDVLWILGA